MSQNSTTNQPVVDIADDQAEASSALVVAEPLPPVDAADNNLFTRSHEFSVESYADRLMDELFDEIEQMLDRGTKFPIEPDRPEFVSLQPISIPHVVIAPETTLRRTPVDDPEPDLASLVSLTSSTESSRRWRESQAFDHLLLVIVGIALLIPAGLWFAFQRNLMLTTTSTTPASSAAVSQTQGDQEFSTYMQHSLEAIDRKAEANRQLAGMINKNSNSSNPTGLSSANPAIPSNLPTVSVPSMPPQPPLPNPPVNSVVPERVYIPVYQPPAVSAPQQAAVPSAAPAAPVAPPSSTVAPAASPPVAAVPNIAPATNYTLVGVIELGSDRSVAMVDINGGIQQVHLGESIGSSGWSLVSIEDGKAIVRRNGEVRSIESGQRF
jgi:hypothetical protein